MIEFDNLKYGKEESEELREQMIVLRNGALEQADFGWAVTLSHVIAWMDVVIKERFDARA